ncbi:MAG: lumenal Hsp70 protein [Thelocarpon impressellum]|nr:MAG: lumenal Hsp70 protein [Thelocarpon impressellum]
MAPPGRRRGALSPLLLTLSFILLLASTASAASAVIGIDLGTEYIKAALVKPGIPLEIVLTKDSRRKEAATVAFKPAAGPAGAFPERLYGSDAVALAARFPSDVYPNLKPLLGLARGSSPVEEEYRSRHPALDVVVNATRNTLAFKSAACAEDEKPFLVEEILAMELQNIRANAEALAGKGSYIRDVVITVPPFYTADERRALELAADLAGLRVLALVSDGLAVGINYATSRTFPSVNDATKPAKPEHHLVFDMGAGSTSATVLRFRGRTVKDVGRTNKTVQEVDVLGAGWDRSLGGDAFNGAILDHMADEFAATAKAKAAGVTVDGVKAHGRAAAKLWKEAERLRQVLSANTETQAGFEGLYEDVDFRYKITRPQLEEMLTHFADRIEAPIARALAAANLSVAELDSVILHGGAVRTPLVQRRLEKLLGDAGKLRSNVNADEAAVFGAAFKGAGLTPGFRVKEIRASDCAGYAVGIDWKSDGKGNDLLIRPAWGPCSRATEHKQKVFLPTSQTGAEKQIPCKNREDLRFGISQHLSGGQVAPVATVQTTNLTKSVAKLADKHGCAEADIVAKFAIRLSPSNGLPEVVRGSVSCEVDDTDKKGSVVDGVKGLFGFGGKKDEQEVLQEGEAEALSGESTPSSSSPSASSSSSSSSSSASKSSSSTAPDADKPRKKTEVIPLSFTATTEGLPEVPVAEIKRLKQRLADFDASDAARRQREEAVNTLEAFTYRARDLLSDDSFVGASTETEREQLGVKLQAASDWLYGDGADAAKDMLKERLKELKAIVNPIDRRRQEAAKRPQEVKLLREALEQSKSLVAMIRDQVDKAASPTAEAEAKPSSPSSAADDDFAELDDDTSTSTSTATSSKAAEASEVPMYTADDVASIAAVHESVDKWLTAKVAEQEKLSAQDDPVLVSADISAKAKELNKAVMDVLQMKMKTPPKAKASSKGKSKTKKGKGKSGTSSSTSTTATTDGEMPTIRVGEEGDMPLEEEMLEALEKAKEKVAGKMSKGKGKGKDKTHDPNEL